MTRVAKQLDLFANILIAGFVVFTLSVPLFRDDLSATANTISDYLVGSYGGLVSASFLLLTVAGFIKALVVKNQLLSIILCAYAVGIVLAAFTYPGDPVHGIGAWTAFTTIPATMLVVWRSTRQNWILAVFAVTVVSFLLWEVLGVGIGERISVFLELAWLAALPRIKLYK